VLGVDRTSTGRGRARRIRDTRRLSTREKRAPTLHTLRIALEGRHARRITALHREARAVLVDDAVPVARRSGPKPVYTRMHDAGSHHVRHRAERNDVTNEKKTPNPNRSTDSLPASCTTACKRNRLLVWNVHVFGSKKPFSISLSIDLNSRSGTSTASARTTGPVQGPPRCATQTCKLPTARSTAATSAPERRSSRAAAMSTCK
jgi:hypothetical protein